MTPAALHQLFGPAVPVYVMEMRTFLLFRVHIDGFKSAAENKRYALKPLVCLLLLLFKKCTRYGLFILASQLTDLFPYHRQDH